ncbi:hypothetical protein ITX31_13225 [Arthrobacter gandavensis]|uniref:hypothetical protein n=1 Tax=Arthrobacter gandavensis TaxID=169960 RepID=UPI00188F9906|nr:hypothetical protein [Arthrobacter gandavensis]MBF4995064.1 hypothetical protein [Arthrobacter gandavensis]
MALTGAPVRLQPRARERRTARTPSVLRKLDVTVLLLVWTICVLTDWDTSAKVALNIAAVVLLCLKEVAFHLWVVRQRMPRVR